MTANLADSLDDLTPAWFTVALREGGVLAAGAAVESVDAGLFGTGQFGLVARAELAYTGTSADGPRSVIVKLPSEDPGSRGLGIAIGAYEAEVRFYQEIAARTGIAVPRPHWTGFEPGTGRVTLVLEDLSDQWRAGDVIAGGSVPQAEAALDQIGRLQSDLWDDPKLRELDWLAAPGRTQMLFDGVPQALPVFRERFGERLEPRHMALVERLAPHGAEYPRVAWSGPMVVAHSDFRLDNVMFRERSGALEAMVIDWQSVRLGPPLLDVAIWLGSSLSPEDRRAHQDALLRRYYDGLVARGVKGFSFDDCREGLRVASLFVFLLSVGVSVTLQRSERGDAMFAGMVAQTADAVAELGADTYFE
jgi:Phosphotransferase enzyme family